MEETDIISAYNLQERIEKAVVLLIDMAKKCTRNKFSPNINFILSEIKNHQGNIIE